MSPSWHENADGQRSAGVFRTHTAKCGATVQLWEQGMVSVCVENEGGGRLCAGSELWRYVASAGTKCTDIYKTLVFVCVSVQVHFSPSPSLSSLAGLVIIHRKNKSGLA